MALTAEAVDDHSQDDIGDDQDDIGDDEEEEDSNRVAARKQLMHSIELTRTSTGIHKTHNAVSLVTQSEQGRRHVMNKLPEVLQTTKSNTSQKVCEKHTQIQ